jgi:hypothetical protein
MTVQVQCRPLSNYPVAETRNRREAPFHRKVTRTGQWSNGTPRAWTETKRVLLSDALLLLEREVDFLGCRRLIIEADFRERDIKLDGWPKANANPATPRVVVSLADSTHGPLRYPCDTFTRFEDNVLAVARALEALRMVDRYGVTRRGEQYAGWKALPGAGSTTMTTEAAAQLLVAKGGGETAAVLRSADAARSAFREAAKRTHPDMANGDRDAFEQVQTARKVLTAHHGVSL